MANFPKQLRCKDCGKEFYFHSTAARHAKKKHKAKPGPNFFPENFVLLYEEMS